MILIVKDGEKKREALAAKLGVNPSDAVQPTEGGAPVSEFDALPISFLPGSEGSVAFEEKLEDFKEYLSEGEQMLSRQFGVMTEEHELFHPNCPAIKITSDLTQYVLIFNEYLYEEGAFRVCDIPYGSAEPATPKQAIRVGNPVAAFLAKEFAKALAKHASKEVYNKFFKKEDDNGFKTQLDKLKTELTQIVGELFQANKQESLEDTLISTRTWFVEHLSLRLTAIQEGKFHNFEELRNDLRTRQERMQDIVSILYARLPDEKLADCDYITRVKVMLYAACACLRILLFKEQIYMERLMAEKGQREVDTTNLEELENFVKEAAERITYYSDALHQGRLNKISEVTPFDRARITYNWLFWETYSGEMGYEWRDDFESLNVNDPLRRGRDTDTRKWLTVKDNNFYKRGPVHEAARESRRQYVDSVDMMIREAVTLPLGFIAENINGTRLELEA
jgi:hypothetical protein